MNLPHLRNAAIGILLLAFCGCWNRVSVEDERGDTDRLRLPSGFKFAPPMRIQQTQTNITVTVIFERIEP